jgi:ubiquinone/menaquinone biosynthesis C-methylase UbiE
VPIANAIANAYDDRIRAEAYAELELHGTYYLAFRDLPAIIGEHVRGMRALDFGCGAGRSTRFLRRLGFDVVGVDISEQMLRLARERDPAGEYQLLPGGDLGALAANSYDLILSAFPFDYVATREQKVALLVSLKRLLKKHGRIVNLVSSADLYVNEWLSFSTREFSGNQSARSGDKALVVMLDVEDRRPIEDILWTHDDYLDVYQRAGLLVHKTYRPLGRPGEAFAWGTELTIAPWSIYMLGAAAAAGR